MAQAPSNFTALGPSSSLRDGVESRLSAAIVSGELAPGTLVSVPTLASQFGVSATPVREAVLNLEKRGFVQSVRNKGFRVTEVGESDLRELVQVRRWLEGPAMRIAAEKLKGASVRHYRDLAERILTAAATPDFEDYLTTDTAFHLELLELVGNRRLVELVAELRSQTRLVGLVAMTNTAELQASAAEHDELITLLSAGRGADAQRLMERHLGHVIGWWAGRREEQQPG